MKKMWPTYRDDISEIEILCLKEVILETDEQKNQLYKIPTFVYELTNYYPGVILEVIDSAVFGFCLGYSSYGNVKFSENHVFFDNAIGLEKGDFFVYDGDFFASRCTKVKDFVYKLNKNILDYKIKDGYEIYMESSNVKNNTITVEDISKMKAKKRTWEQGAKIKERVDLREQLEKERQKRDRKWQKQKAYERESIFEDFINKNVITTGNGFEIVLEKNINKIFDYDDFKKDLEYKNHSRYVIKILYKKKANFMILRDGKEILKFKFEKSGISINGIKLTTRNLKTVFNYIINKNFKFSEYDIKVINKYGVGCLNSMKLKNIKVKDFVIPIKIKMMKEGLLRIKIFDKNITTKCCIYAEEGEDSHHMTPNLFMRLFHTNMGLKKQYIFNELKKISNVSQPLNKP